LKLTGEDKEKIELEVESLMAALAELNAKFNENE